MKNSCKKIVAAILATCMLFTMVTIASASTTSDKAQSLLSSAEYKYWVDDAVLPSDVLIKAFDNNNMFSLYWGGLFTENNAFLENAQKFYAMNIVDAISLAKYEIPEFTQSDIDAFVTAFGNKVIDHLGYPGTDVKVGESSKVITAMTQVYDDYNISARGVAAIDSQSLCPDVAELTAYVMLVRDYVTDLNNDLNNMYYDESADGNIQAALDIVKSVINIAEEMTEKYIYTEKTTDLADALENGFYANLGAAFVEYITTNNLVTGTVTYNNKLTLCENFASSVDECAKYFVAMKFAVNNYEPVFKAAIDNASTAMNAATEDADIDAAAEDVISRTDLYLGLVKYETVLSAAFVTTAETSTQQNYYKLIREFLNNIKVADADLAKDTAGLNNSEKWSLIAKSVVDAVDASTTDMTAADFTDSLVLTSTVASAKASFANIGLANGMTIYITTSDYSLAYETVALAADGTIEIKNLLPGTYGWLAKTGNNHGTITLSESGVVTVTDLSNEAISSTTDSSATSSETSSAIANTTSSTGTSKTSNPKTGDSSAVFFATLICMAAAAAYVFTKRVRD